MSVVPGLSFPSESWPLPPLFTQRSNRGQEIEAQLEQEGNGSKEGFKRMVLSTTVISYEGDYLNGLYSGSGVALFKNGCSYRGEFVSGLMDGVGRYRFEDGSEYEGTMRMNAISGQGKFLWSDGSTYEGEVLDGYRHGTGTFTDESIPCIYTGQWEMGLRNGRGILKYDLEGKSFYDGDWVTGQRHGKGMLRYGSGNEYHGDWVHDRKEGHGTMVWKNSNQKYVGTWLNDLPHYEGEYTWYDLPNLKAVNTPHGPRPTTKFQHENRYVGNFDRGVRQGHGSFFYASGAVYNGEWNKDRKQGYGQYTFENGTSYNGGFENDKMVNSEIWENDANSIELNLDQLIEEVEVERVGNGKKNKLKQLLQTEKEKLNNLLLRFNSDLLDIYRYYSHLELDHPNAPAHQPTMVGVNQAATTRMTLDQFWSLINDLGIIGNPEYNIPDLSLAYIDRLVVHRLLYDPNYPNQRLVHLSSVHDAHNVILLRQFSEVLVRIAVTMFQHVGESDSEGGNLIAEANANFNVIILGQNQTTNQANSSVQTAAAVPPLPLAASTAQPFSPTGTSFLFPRHVSTTDTGHSLNVSQCFKKFVQEVLLPRAKTKSKHGGVISTHAHSQSTTLSVPRSNASISSFPIASTISSSVPPQPFSVLLAKTPIYRLPSLIALVKQYDVHLRSVFDAISTDNNRPNTSSNYRYPLADKTVSIRALLIALKARPVLTEYFTIHHVLDVIFGLNYQQSNVHSLMETELIFDEFITFLIKIGLYRGKIQEETRRSLQEEQVNQPSTIPLAEGQQESKELDKDSLLQKWQQDLREFLDALLKQNS